MPNCYFERSCCCCCCKYQFCTLYRFCRFITVVFSEMKFFLFWRRKKDECYLHHNSKGAARVRIITVYFIIIKDWCTVYTLVFDQKCRPVFPYCWSLHKEFWLKFISLCSNINGNGEDKKKRQPNDCQKIISIDSWHDTMCACVCHNDAISVSSISMSFAHLQTISFANSELNNTFCHFMFVATADFESYLLFTTK